MTTLVAARPAGSRSGGPAGGPSGGRPAAATRLWPRWSLAHPLAAYILRRLLFYVGSLWGAFTVTFVFFHLIPGDPIQSFIISLQQNEVYGVEAGQEVVEHYRKLFGLEGNLAQQYFAYMYRVLVAHDLGPALINFPTPVHVIVLRALPWTIGLLTLAAVMGWVLGLALGTLAGWKRQSVVAQWLTNFGIALSTVPYYFVALMLLFVFAYRLAWLPSSAAYQASIMPGFSLDFVFSVIRHGTLPALSILLVAAFDWLVSTRMLTVTTLGEDYLTFADAKGLKPRHILVHYVLRNCYLPQITAFGIQLGAIFNGNVLLERIFNYPGLGNLLVQAIGVLDFNTVQGIIALAIFGVLTANLIIDLLLPVLDPRVKYWR
jgi:peptide/nickel transport system permease protein